MKSLVSRIYKTVVQKTFMLPILAFISITALVFTLWDKSVLDYQVWVKSQIQQAGEITTQEFISSVRKEIIQIENLKNRIQFTEGNHQKFWDQDVNMLLEQSNSIKFVEWIDTSMVVRKVNPTKGNEDILNLDISNLNYRNEEWIAHTLDSSINITPWIKLTQGGNALLIDVPTYYDNKFQGTVTAGMDFTSNFNKFAARLRDYCVELRDDKGTLIFEYNEDKKAVTDSSFIFTKQLTIDYLEKHFWHLKIYPTNDLLFLTNKRTFINYTLIFGITLSFLISMLIYFYLKALNATSRVLNINRKLANVNTSLNIQKQKAEEASIAKTDFLSNMSHEIRTPLHAILGFIQVLKGSKLEEKDKEYVNLMDKSSNNLLTIVNDILEIHKIESGAISLEEHLFCPSKKLQELIETYAYHFKEKGLTLNLNLVEPAGLNVKSDMSKYSQIITNLLKNALKFTIDGGVEVEYKEERIAEKLKISIIIKDSGIGISKNKLKSIFNRFTQIESSLKKQHEGSGLGLSISKDFAELLDGSITVISKPESGSSFTFNAMLNISDQNMLQINETFDNLKLPHLKVLVVDDNTINVIVLKKLLQDIDIQVDAVSNGQMAIDKFRTEDYQLILMDVHMPQMDGYEATSIIREEDDKIIIIGLSANVTSTAIQKALDSGMTNYLTKPFTKERLYKLILTYFT
ncbi:hybrid sensor histidine kinase/response regulator [Bizionia myxarmorum]|uniref:histidine kinase n=1 Tax=Bizionia myxarmorum TaxID=291186 RepID=A0A5D0RCZ5_9FLAO|nr:response regulator [Bizionia myxarmorum]TYB79382.1 response regulator [Bizionia myxarmorum]